MNEQTAAIILAAGRGTRLNSQTINKVALPFNGKPIIEYAVEAMEPVASHVVVVVGAFADSVKEALKNHPAVIYAEQTEQLGTGHAAKVGLEPLKPFTPTTVLVGYGDHMMFYTPETIQKLIDLHTNKKATISMITVRHEEPNKLAWGRIVRDEHDTIVKSVEQKDANDDELMIEELNAGFYAFDYQYLSETIDLVPRSEVSGEYYLNALISMAAADGRTLAGLVVPFEEVGIGINRAEELEASQKLHESRGNAI
ncbi:NTP transferase domain-containing protein [Candidatus Microgenomates bacterium]|nr:NTP transferase domain-containing protein [Candidatus Microgenomates bacterium]